MVSKNKYINVWSYLEEYDEYREEISEIVKKVFESGRLIFGEELKSFEINFANWIGNKYGVGVGNGTDAIKLSLLASGIGKGDEVITVSNTAVPTVSAIIETGARPVFCDVNKDDFNIDTSLVESLISKKTKAIVCVHLYGHPANITELKKICKIHNLILIEDCAQSHGASYKNKKTGSFGDSAAFSFYPTKILGAYGDAGLVTTSSKKIDEKLRMLRFYGMKNQYFSEIEDGVNTRLDEVQAAILNMKLKRLDKDILRRREIANFYNSELTNTNLILPLEKKNYFHSYYLYVVRHKNRDEIIKKLRSLGINLNISYPFPIHTMPPFKKYRKSKQVNTLKLSEEIFSLPMYPGISDNELTEVTNKIKLVLKK
jgi:aminotransferase EvaB|tara:strand:- start:764 stop:1879 length:1116 start_codon:yes stop_codon:yes gene_type:complete